MLNRQNDTVHIPQPQGHRSTSLRWQCLLYSSGNFGVSFLSHVHIAADDLLHQYCAPCNAFWYPHQQSHTVNYTCVHIICVIENTNLMLLLTFTFTNAFPCMSVNFGLTRATAPTTSSCVQISLSGCSDISCCSWSHTLIPIKATNRLF